MRSFLLFLFLSFCIPVSLFAQATVNFETNGNNWEWILFQPTKATFDVVANPSKFGNTTDSCAMLQITDITADPWSGVFSMDFPDFTISASNCYVRIWVYKDHISNVGLKLEPARTSDYNIPNTVINQWEEILFDYSAYIGSQAATLAVIPDFSTGPPRPYTSTSYFDQISFTDVVPVELTSFTGQYVGNTTQLNWTTATELNNLGFEVQRSLSGSTFATIAFVEGKGTTTEAQQYSFTDRNVTAGVDHAYRLKQIDYSGDYHFSQVVNLGESNPVNFELAQNYPNPFNPSTTISIGLPVKSDISLDIYNIVGEKVLTLYNGELEAGNYDYNVNASNLPSGIYIYVLNSVGEDGNHSVLSRKMTLLK